MPIFRQRWCPSMFLRGWTLSWPVLRHLNRMCPVYETQLHLSTAVCKALRGVPNTHRYLQFALKVFVFCTIAKVHEEFNFYKIRDSISDSLKNFRKIQNLSNFFSLLFEYVPTFTFKFSSEIKFHIKILRCHYCQCICKIFEHDRSHTLQVESKWGC